MRYDKEDLKKMLKRKEEELEELKKKGSYLMQDYLEGQIDLLKLILGEEVEF